MADPETAVDPSTVIDVSAVPWLREQIVFLTRTGSRAYGTSLEDSDLDIRGVAIPPPEIELRLYQRGFEAYANQFPAAPDRPAMDLCVWGLSKFMQMCATANPNALELLFVDDDSVLMRGRVFLPLMASRKMFLSKRILNSYLGTVRQFRARMEESGWDPKTAMHQVRLLNAARDALEGKPWVVRCPDLLPIRRGEIPRERVETRIRELEEEVRVAGGRSTLPLEPDVQALEYLYRSLVTNSWTYTVAVPCGGWEKVEMTYNGARIQGRKLMED